MKFGYAEQGVMKGIIRDFAMGNADIWDLIERIKLNFGYRFDNDMSMGYRFVKNNGTALLIGHAMSRDPQYHFLYRLNAFVERQKKMTVPMDELQVFTKIYTLKTMKQYNMWYAVVEDVPLPFVYQQGWPEYDLALHMEPIINDMVAEPDQRSRMMFYTHLANEFGKLDTEYTLVDYLAINENVELFYDALFHVYKFARYSGLTVDLDEGNLGMAEDGKVRILNALRAVEYA